ncbi:hypothetical protein DFH29DRAFT_877582 [Suillus ampliporus]|nr:hypothetical protein DFH29DRAFT_877582 [Suillus ampliporus]
MSTTTSITPEEIQGLELYLLAAPNIKYISLAGLTLFTWDLILTFPHEKFSGNSLDYGWTLTKVLFFMNRYFALGAAILMTFLTFDVTPTEAICSVNAFFGVVALLLVANIENKRIVVPVSALFIAIFTIMMVMAVIVYMYEKDREAQIFGACCILGSVDWLYLFWYLLSWTIITILLTLLFRIPMMGLDFVLVVLAGYKSLQHYFKVPDKTWSGAHLMRTFARDSILYFLCNFLVYLFSTLLGKFGPSEYFQLGAITITVIPPISANRLLINMYNSAHTEQGRDTLRVHHDNIQLRVSHHPDIELSSMDMKGSLEVSMLDDISAAKLT